VPVGRAASATRIPVRENNRANDALRPSPAPTINAVLYVLASMTFSIAASLVRVRSMPGAGRPQATPGGGYGLRGNERRDVAARPWRMTAAAYGALSPSMEKSRPAPPSRPPPIAMAQ